MTLRATETGRRDSWRFFVRLFREDNEEEGNGAEEEEGDAPDNSLMFLSSSSSSPPTNRHLGTSIITSALYLMTAPRDLATLAGVIPGHFVLISLLFSAEFSSSKSEENKTASWRFYILRGKYGLPRTMEAEEMSRKEERRETRSVSCGVEGELKGERAKRELKNEEEEGEEKGSVTMVFRKAEVESG
ncbi:uncharacterized protein MONOS_8103 [Monocercomonoides exilis]|uniref:uncharacterized protein n=1 Tax=Monocercomonoides exilis TaxID=2049356 RepID=UPI003559B4F8|nr:hypothetical protein MONOS_8103 [Monocercomonoides exilis]|eukprot:MONOS_8103.1-p1 / transcript=MONOS_8103.1 / gene=MONOS_8103 / organism=Monocercomonoides_exilis_PA203 / gene_product=unspecified product / transcript_product=unspecified product / location=Mono_scaffold00296:29769-30332(-) / protein_length=188 / sequence_SO=supercontig / SO=protein_coding / is_pseudo=false